MKRILLAVTSFIVSFVAAYLIICYLPSMRIKLEAEPVEYFVASIKHNMGFKILISLVFGLLNSFISAVLTKRAK